MKKQPTWIQQADAALKRAARTARKTGERTRTPVYVQEGNKIVNLTAGTRNRTR